ncbi:hypothetical protein amrb99_97700 [Actinomadura sp. RB99]|uniref:hypothetical protein n=1 Tax=Actinomadura sp. RB99 TaxID=2691577 RepID=UPI001687266D|nr:hypothetical protein [Actinomadura sp. RB99]MBD2900761.1 hypothetical protein [Actinomadura sp. RB99]
MRKTITITHPGGMTSDVPVISLPHWLEAGWQVAAPDEVPRRDLTDKPSGEDGARPARRRTKED